MFEMSESSGWKKTLTNILEELRKQQQQKMLECLDKIPKSVKDDTPTEEMAQIIIEHYGEEESITEIKRIMDEEIPRRDPVIQNMLHPFVEKQGTKRKPGPESKEQQESPSELKKNKKTESDDDVKAGFESDSDSSDDETQADDPGSSQSDKKKKPSGSWRRSIKQLKENGDTNRCLVVGKVVKKCALRTYETKEKQEKKFFHLAVADETDCIKVTVYREELFNKVEEGRLYLFTDVEVDVVYGETVMKVIKHSKISKTNAIKVPKTLELQSPFFSIKKIQSFKEKTAVSVKGTVIEIDPQKDGTKGNTQEFKLEDETGSIWIMVWPNDIEKLRGISTGDLVIVTNLLTNRYHKTVSLNSTDFIRVHKMKAAAVQSVIMQIIGIIKGGKKQCEVEVLINQKSRSLFIKSHLLAKVFGVKLDDNFENRLVEKTPFLAKGKIEGNKIQTLNAAKAMKMCT